MATDGEETSNSFKFPLSPLSPGRVNIPRHGLSTTLPNSPSAPQIVDPSAFGHPEFGRPGDFSKFSNDEDSADFKPPPPIRPPHLQSQPSLRSPVAASNSSSSSSSSINNNYNSRFEFSNWSPPKLHARTNSDVQGMVARFNSLDIKDHADLRKRDAAALKRAQMGREEAEEESKKLREEARASKKEIEEGRDREQRVVKRLDVVMEDLHRTKETQAHAQSLYEKEIRKARKEAFKASSTLVKLQEELKIARKALGVAQSDLDLERIKGGRREQDVFTAQYQLVGVQEELAQSLALVKVVEAERDALKMTLKEEEVARIAAEGRIALPAPKGTDDEFDSPKKHRAHIPLQTPSKNQTHPKQDLDRLRSELEMESRRRELAEEQVEFMKMECQFGCCSCKIAESQGESFIHDGSFETEVQKFKDAIASILTPPKRVLAREGSTSSAADYATTLRPATLQQKFGSNGELDLFTTPKSTVSEVELHTIAASERRSAPIEALDTHIQDASRTSDEANSPNTQTHKAAMPKTDGADASLDSFALDFGAASRASREQTVLGNHLETGGPEEDHYEQPLHESPVDSPFRTVTTTTKIPLADASTPDYSAFCSPMKLTREEAIEKLRQRRGRARSVAGTPKKSISEAPTPRRDVSAPEVRDRATPKQSLKRSG